MKKEYIPYCIALIALLPCIFLRDYTISNELRYLSIADEALREHNLFAFTSHGEIYADKPPMYLWIVMLGKLLFGSHQMWFLTLFSFLPTIGVVEILRRWTLPYLTEEWQKSAQVLLLSTLLFLSMLIVLRMDILMCFFITCALYTFWKMQADSELATKKQWALGGFTFLALFAKGPIGFIVPILATTLWLIFSKRIKEWTHYWGWRAWTILLGSSLAWFFLVALEGGHEYLNNLLFHQTVDRAVNSFHHARPFYFYLLSILYMSLPWTLLTIGSIAIYLFKKKELDSLQTYFLTIIGSTFILLSCFSGKLDVYLLPIYPFITYLAVMILQKEKETSRWTRFSIAFPGILLLLGGIGGILYLLTNSHEVSRTLYQQLGVVKEVQMALIMGLVLGGIAAIAGAIQLFFIIKKRDLHQAMHIIFYALFGLLFVGSFTLPAFNKTFGYYDVCQKMNEVAEKNDARVIYTYGLSRTENMDVFCNRPIYPIYKENAMAILPNGIILFNKNDDITGIILNKEVHQIGPYHYVDLKQ